MEINTSSQLEILVTIRYVANNQEATVQVERFPYLIGRDSSSVQLALPDATVSRKHAQLIFQDGAVLIENISETNKTAVNGQYIDRPTPLSTGDQAILGSSKLFFDIQHIAEIVNPALGAEAAVTEALPVSKQDESEKAEPALKESDPPQTVQSNVPAEPRYCRQCGQPLPAQAAFCGNCGTATQTEIVGQPMFCSSCGSKVGRDFRFCPQCGKSAGQGQEQADTPQTEPSRISSPDAPAKHKNNKRLVGIIAVALPVVLLLVATIVFLGGRSYQSVIRQYIDAAFDGDLVKVWKLLPDEMQDEVLDYLDIDDISDVEDALGADLSDVFSYAWSEYGEDFKYSYEIAEERDFSKAEIRLLKSAMQAVGVEDIEIDAAKSLEIVLTIKPADGEEYQQTVSIDVAKIGRSWHLAGLGY